MYLRVYLRELDGTAHAENPMFASETQIAVIAIIITLVRELKYYDCLLSYFTECTKKQ